MTIRDVDESKVYKCDRVKLEGGMVLSLANFYGDDLTKAGFLIPAKT